MNIRIREMAGSKAESVRLSDDDLSILRSDDFAGSGLDSEQIIVRRMLLCHDQYDRTFERFPKGYLQQFVKTLPGKSVLACHDSGGWGGGQSSLPLARFYRAGLTEKTEPHPIPVSGRRRMQSREFEAEDADSKGESIPLFEEQQTRVTWLKSSFYFANHESNEALRMNIDLGVYKWVSIGFRYDDLDCDICKTSYLRSDCPHILGWETEDGKLVTGTYSGDPKKAEALEGSIVYLGAQPRARLIKQLHEGAVDPKAVSMTPYGEDLVLLKEAEAMAREFGHARKSWAVGIDFAKGESLTDLSFDDHSEAVLTAVEGYVRRSELLKSRRAKDGRTVTGDRVEAWKSLRSQIDSLCTSGESIAPDIKTLETDLLRHEADLQGFLLGV